jgi:hypothetical protein
MSSSNSAWTAKWSSSLVLQTAWGSQWLKVLPRLVVTSLCGTTRAFLSSHTASLSRRLTIQMGSNDAAIKRAEDLSKQHGVKASAYKVDGQWS